MQQVKQIQVWGPYDFSVGILCKKVLIAKNAPRYNTNMTCDYNEQDAPILHESGIIFDSYDDMRNYFSTIARTMAQCTGKNILMDSTKNASSYRTMPMIPAIRDILLALRERREQFQLLFPENYSKCNQVFVWDDGTPITPNYLSKEFHRVVKSSHLPCIRLHDLRHGTASNLLANGFSVVEVQHWLGHSQPSTTLNIYSHVDESVRQHVGERIADFLQLDSL